MMQFMGRGGAVEKDPAENPTVCAYDLPVDNIAYCLECLETTIYCNDNEHRAEMSYGHKFKPSVRG